MGTVPGGPHRPPRTRVPVYSIYSNFAKKNFPTVYAVFVGSRRPDQGYRSFAEVGKKLKKKIEEQNSKLL